MELFLQYAHGTMGSLTRDGDYWSFCVNCHAQIRIYGYDSICSMKHHRFRIWDCNECGRTPRSDDTGGVYTVGAKCKGIDKRTCSRCGGDGKVDKPINCSHGRSSSHSYCSHNKTSQHDN